MSDQEEIGEPMYGDTEQVYVKFGPAPTQEMPREWAEKMLTKWCERKPADFGKLLAEVVTEGRNGHK